jgi:hypothetical protein
MAGGPVRCVAQRVPSAGCPAVPVWNALSPAPSRACCRSCCSSRRLPEGCYRKRRDKIAIEIPSMLPLLSSSRAYVFLHCMLWALCHMAPLGLAASCGVGTSCRQRPSLRADFHVRHPLLSASGDERWQACGRRPHLSDGVFAWPGRATGRLHQRHGRRLTQHRTTADASFRTAPAGKTPLLRHRHSAMSHCRATATIPMRLTRLPPPPKRARHQQRRALSPTFRTPILDFLNNSGRNHLVARNDGLTRTILYD